MAWYQRRGAADAPAPMLRLVAVRRAPGGAFGPVEPFSGFARGFTAVDGGGRTRFVARLRRPEGRVRWIAVTAYGWSGGTRAVVVPLS